MRKVSNRQIFFITTTVLIILIAFLLSNQTSGSSKDLSLSFAKKIITYFEKHIVFIKNSSEMQLQLVLNNFLRKLAHIFIYFLLGISVYNVFSSFIKKYYFVIAFTIIFSLITAALDEFHQLFVVGRGAQIQDVLIDMIGVLLALMLMLACKAARYLIIKKYKEDKESNL